jgi:hypothetical protein
MEEIIETVRDLEGALVQQPEPGSDVPEIAWGDAFFYYAPDGELPRNVQPYGTVVTKNYPGDIGSDLDPPDRWRVNVHVDSKSFVELVGEEPRSLSRSRDHAAADVVNPHPVYGALSWICVVNPGKRTEATVLKLLQDAHGAARLRSERRAGMDRGEEA